MANETATTFVLLLTNKSCTERLDKIQCFMNRHGQTAAYFFLALALLPQILHLQRSVHRYVAGVSYLWIIIRIFALMSLILVKSFHWLSVFVCIGLIMSIVIFTQIVLFSNNLHRQNKIILIVVSLVIWLTGKILIYYLVKEKRVLINIIYILFAIQMLPQVKSWIII